MPPGHFIFVLLLIIQQSHISREKNSGQPYAKPTAIDEQHSLQAGF
jgi:hypothetical protein